MTTEIVAPTCEQLWEDKENFGSVFRDADDSWRHGSYITQVFHRLIDGTYWMAQYRKSGDGETNELREGRARISQVWPQRVVTETIKYVGVKPAGAGDSADEGAQE